MSRKEILDNFYTNCCNEEERLVSKHGSVEFLTTTKYIDERLKPGDKILEVGAGTGKYSLYYASKGYTVHAIEYVEKNVTVLQSKIQQGMSITAEQGDALDLSRFEKDSFNMTLVLGPLYHLYTSEDIDKAIKEAIRVTKPGGIIAFAYLTSDSIMLDWVLKENHLLDGYKKDFNENFKMINYPEGIFSSFYISEFEERMSKFDVHCLKNIATDGMAQHFADKIDALSDDEFAVWLKYHFSTCERKELQGYSNHMLYICQKE